ncbi:MAG TPA: hypothetical protein VLJ37_07650 [bacterium]|nr:hypothetical protein [bacterium]
MIWLFKKIFGLGIAIALVFFALHFQIGGRPAKDYVVDVYRSAIVQEAIRQGKDSILSYLRKDISPPNESEGESAPPMEHLDDDERRELEDVLKKESR